MTTATRSRTLTEAERDAQEWQRIADQRARDQAEREAARRSWTPAATAAVEGMMRALFASWRTKRDGNDA